MRVMIYTKMKKGFDQYLFYSKTFSYAEEMADFDLDFELFKVVKSGIMNIQELFGKIHTVKLIQPWQSS